MSRPDRVAGPARERGQSTVELALVLPIIAVSVLMVVQVAVLAATKVATVQMARDVARSVAIAGEIQDGRWDSARGATNPNGLLISVELVSAESGGPKQVCVTVVDPDPASFSLFAAVLNQIEVGSTAKMVVE